METRLVDKFAQYQSAKAIWDSLTTTYGSGADPFQIYDLEVKANKVSQDGRDLEDFWAELQALWVSIDQQQPHPLNCCEKGIGQYRALIDNRRLFQFLSGLDEQFDGSRRDILKTMPLPSAEAAFSTVRREAARLRILRTTSGNLTAGNSSSGEIGVGLGIRPSGHRQGTGKPPQGRNQSVRSGNPSQRDGKIDKNKLYCTHCGMTKHTKETCFRLVGYPDWWEENPKNPTAKSRIAVGMEEFRRADAVLAGNPEATNARKSGDDGAVGSEGGRGQNEEEEAARAQAQMSRVFEGKGFGSLPNPSNSIFCKSSPHTFHFLQNRPPHDRELQISPQELITPKASPITCTNRFHALEHLAEACHIRKSGEKRDKGWIFDCGATDTMTYDRSDIIGLSKSARTHVQTASGELAPVEGAGTIQISPTLKISNCLYVPSLSHKLMSISHVTKELNCTLLMHPRFCFLQDIRTGTIIGRGTERHGLYYVDEIAQQGSAMLAQGAASREAWLWHRRFGHPSTGYLKLLFPKLMQNQTLSCDTCVLAKSHRQTFKPNNTRVDSIFALVHSDIWGLSPVEGGQGFRYFLLFIGDCTRMTRVYFLK